MNFRIVIKILIIGISIVIINGCQNSHVTLGYLEFSEEETDEDGLYYEYNERVKVPSFNLLNQDNMYLSNSDLLGSNYIVNFFFTSCPTICPTTTLNLLELQKKIKQDDIGEFKIISISVDPKNDTPEILKQYASSMNIDMTNWELLTGPQDEIYNIVQSGFMLAVGQDSLAPGGVFHSSMITIVDDKGYIRTGFDIQKKTKFVYDGTLWSDMQLLICDLYRLNNKNCPIKITDEAS